MCGDRECLTVSRVKGYARHFHHQFARLRTFEEPAAGHLEVATAIHEEAPSVSRLVVVHRYVHLQRTGAVGILAGFGFRFPTVLETLAREYAHAHCRTHATTNLFPRLSRAAHYALGRRPYAGKTAKGSVDERIGLQHRRFRTDGLPVECRDRGCHVGHGRRPSDAFDSDA